MSQEFNQIPVFENGAAQPVFPFTDGKTGDEYCAADSAIVRYCVYIETDYDVDGDGRRDRVKAFVQVPRSAAEGHYKAATVYEARPYCAGINADGYDHMKEVDSREYPPFRLNEDLDNEAAPTVPTGKISALEAAEAADPADWYFPDKGNGGSMCYENIDNYNYYLVRGFAVVTSAGFGTLGSDGFEYVGSHYERDAFKAVVEWLHGDRVGYTDRTGTVTTAADWSNGNVGMTGRSYAGTMPFAVATTGVPGLATIVPVAGIADWYSQQNQQGAQRYWAEEMLNSFLSYYCTSRYSDSELTAEMKARMDAFHHALSLEQMKYGTDYSEFWKDGNYTLAAGGIRCSALIVHGLNDENVSTKQFEMMLHSFEQAEQTVKLILHQGPHMTPAMQNKGYGIRVSGEFYEDIVNRWMSHYLYDVDNGAEDMPALLVQNNRNQHIWETAESWETGKRLLLKSISSGIDTIDTDWAAADICSENFDERMSTSDTNMNMRNITRPLEEEITIQGTVRVDFKAALAGGDPETGFHAENVNNVDKLTFSLGTSAGRQDDLKMTVLLCDVCDEPFDSIAASDPQRNVVPMKVVREGGFPNGGALDALDESEFATVNRKYSVITRAYVDLCNPESGYAPETAEACIVPEIGEYHSYHVYMNATRYTLAPGHRLVVSIGTEDPVYCLSHKDYKIEINRATVAAELPVTDNCDKAIALSR